ncbi:MAG TPA: hypothetical protein VMU90_06655 [Solirubrobacteraceae bacterium]|nr:hypothetical protein [Solirubrobacteraceae bacterium]
MPQAKTKSARKRPASSSQSRTAGAAARRSFSEPPALKRLNRSLETAETALAELSKSAGRDVSQGARGLYKDLSRFVSTARRDTRKLGKALQKDFDQAVRRLEGGQKQLKRRTTTTESKPKKAK